MHYQILSFLFLCFFIPIDSGVRAQGQSDQLNDVRSMLNQLANLPAYEYSYTATAIFPDGKQESLRGSVFMDIASRTFFSSNNAQIFFYQKDWLYKADLNNKEIAVVNVTQRIPKAEKESFEKKIFGQGYFSNFLDSAIMKYARVQHFKTEKDSVKFILDFPAGMPIKSMSLVYDQKNNTPVSYSMSMYYPYPSNEKRFKNAGTQYFIACDHYAKNPDWKKYRPDTYYKIHNGNVELVKYKTFKLNSSI